MKIVEGKESCVRFFGLLSRGSSNQLSCEPTTLTSGKSFAITAALLSSSLSSLHLLLRAR